MIWLFLSPSHSNSFVHVALIFFSIFSHSLSLVWNRLLFEIIIFSFLRAASNNSTIFSSFFNSLSYLRTTVDLRIGCKNGRHKKKLNQPQKKLPLPHSEPTNAENRRTPPDSLTHPRKQKKCQQPATFYFMAQTEVRKKIKHDDFFSSLHLTCSASVQLHFCSPRLSCCWRWQRSKKFFFHSRFFPSSSLKIVHQVRTLFNYTHFIYFSYHFFLLPLTRLTHHVACRCAAHSV